jgi:oxygen-independent coproporphyrinogen-3 oxidase
MFSVPGQTTEDALADVERILSFEPEHISCYSLQIEEGTPFASMVESGEMTEVPDEEDRETYHKICARLKEAGYEHYEISSFAKDGHYSHHNLHYWQRGEYLGFGPGAHSHWNGKRFSNLPDLCGYLANPLGCNDYKKAERIDETEMWEEDVLLGLRTSFGIPAHSVPAAPVERMIALGLMGRRGENVFLTERGWRVSNAVIGQLLL